MTTKLDELLSGLPVERQRRIHSRSDELIDEELTLREIRRAFRQSQETVAEVLNTNQPAVSKLERRDD